jgi:membrane protease YdiL (CAAX protease family)
MNSLRRIVRSRELLIALSLVLVVNALFVGGIHSGAIPEKFYYYGRFLLLGATLGTVVLIGSGFSGVLDLLRPMLRWRISLWWYLLAFTWAASMCVLTLVGKIAVTGAPLSILKPDLSVILMPAVMVTIFIGSFVGEIVWVSYAIRKLSARFTPFIGSQIVGVVWTLWWMPMVLLNVGVFPDLPPVALLVSMLGIAAMCSFVYHHTKSGIAVLILQMIVNSTSVIFPVIPHTGGVGTFVAYGIIYYTAVVLLYLRFGPKPILPGRVREPEVMPAGQPQ